MIKHYFKCLLATILLSQFYNPVLAQSDTVVYEDFSVCALPTNWTQTSPSSDAWEFCSAVNFGSTSTINDPSGNSGNYANVDFSDDPDSTAMVTPVLSVGHLSGGILSFWYNSQTTSTAFSPLNQFYVDYWNGSTWVGIMTDSTNGGWKEYRYTLSSYTYSSGDSARFRFGAHEGGTNSGGTGSNTFSQDMALDQIYVGKAPSCPTGEIDSIANITASSMQVFFSPSDSSSGFLNLSYQKSGGLTQVVKGISTTSGSYTITGLDPITSYEIMIQDSCANGNSAFHSTTTAITGKDANTLLFEPFKGSSRPSGWTDSSPSSDSWEYGQLVDRGSTSTVIPDADGNTGEYANLDFSDDPDTTALVTPVIDASGLSTIVLSFDYFSETDDNGFTPLNQFWVDYWNGSSWVTIIRDSVVSGWTPFLVDVSTYKFSTDSLQFRFVGHEGGSNSGGTGTFTFNQDMALDNIYVGAAPPCPFGSLDSITNITSNSAVINFSASDSTSGYMNLAYTNQGNPLSSATIIRGLSTTGGSYNLTGLSSGFYDVYYQDSCPNGNSGFYGPASIFIAGTDLVLDDTTSFEVNLEDFVNSSTNTSIWDTTSNLASEGSLAAINEYGNNEDNILFLPRPINTSTYSTVIFSFDQIAKTEGGYDDCLVEYSNDGLSWNALPGNKYLGNSSYGTDLLFDEDSYSKWGTSTTPAMTNSEWENERFLIDNSLGSKVFIRFRLNSDGSATREGWYVDNIQFNEDLCFGLDSVTLSIDSNITCFGADNGVASASFYNASSPFSYSWSNGDTTSTANDVTPGNLSVTITDANGCTVSDTVNFVEPSLISSTDTKNACGSYTWINGVTYSSSNNTAKDTLMSVSGCDSVVTLNLTIYNPASSTDTVVACDSYTWVDGITYTASNTTSKDTLTTVNGCDSIVTLNLTINSSSSATDTVVACDSYTWIDGVTYTTSNNTAMDTLMNAMGCDSVVTLNLTINNSNSATDTVVACDSYTWIDGVTYTTSNTTAKDTLMNAIGCDSVVTLHLTINNSSAFTDTIVACDTYTWIDGNTYTTSNNTATDTLTTVTGCDSIITLHLTINNSSSSTDTQVACDRYTWIDGNTYTMSNNTATYTLVGANGCDSVITLNLTINNSTMGIDSIVACDTYTWIDGITYTESDTTATFTVTNSAGCDSVVTLHLTIDTVSDATVSIIDNELVTANTVGSGFQWIPCDSTQSIDPSATNQTYTPTENGEYTVIVTENGCVDTANCIDYQLVSLRELSTIPVKLYPNPNKGGSFTLDLSGQIASEVFVFDSKGTLVFKTEKVQSEQYFDLELNSGVYYVQFEVNSELKRMKMIVNE